MIGSPLPPDTKEEVLSILRKSPIQRGLEGLPVTMDEIAVKYHMSPATVSLWNRMSVHSVRVDLPVTLEEAKPPAEVKKKIGRPLKYDYQSYLRSRTREIDEALISKALSGHVNAIEQFNKLLGRLTDKSEVKIGPINAQEFIKRNLEAERELRDRGYRVLRADGPGVADVPGERPILPEPVRVDSEREHGETD